MATPAKHEFHIRDLATAHVILYPSRAHITRTIGNIDLQPGPNQIEIYGITPTADESSVKIEGTGVSASITDMTVDLVPNKESFKDIHPFESDSDQSDSDQSDSDSADLDVDIRDVEDDSYPLAAKSVKEEVETLELRLKRLEEVGSTNKQSNDYLGIYCNSLATKSVSAAGANDVLDLYERQRLKTFDAFQEAFQASNQLNKDLKSKKKELYRLTKQWATEKRKKKKQAKKEKEARERQKDQKRREALRLVSDQEQFWPKQVYRVVVHIDLPTDTPGSSRRSSFSSLTTLPKDPQSVSKASDEEPSTASRSTSLLLSYVTADASWSPRYDISFSTPTKTGSIIYRAQFRNTTSETWKDTKVSLSTSQASFRGLDDEVPFMHQWNIGLIKNSAASALMNNEEIHFKQKAFTAQPVSSNNRAELFGVPRQGALFGAGGGTQQPHRMRAKRQNQTQNFGFEQAKQRQAVQPVRAQMAAAPSGFMEAASAALPRGGAHESYESADEEMAFGALGDSPEPTLQQEDATWEDNGLTQTYELPSTRTLAPSNLTRRHKIASLPFKDLSLTSISVPKLRPAAFLRARFRNPSSSIALLKGTAGLTLDGTFLGNTSLPRVSPGELITLPLGVDPSIQIAYSKPTSKRSTQGLFNKEAAQVYTRNVFITNTKSVPSDILVLDQVPVSTDEKLRVEVLQPKGLSAEGDTAPAGVDAKQAKSKNWGRAKATYKKNGEIAWEVTVEKGSACRLALEYEVRLPAAEGIQSL